MPETGGAVAAAVSGAQVTRKDFWGPRITGAELRAYRTKAGLTQATLAKKARIGRHAVSYWECKARVPLRGWAVERMLEAMGLDPCRIFTAYNAPARGWGVTIPDPWQTRLDAFVDAQMAQWHEREAKRAARRRVRCGAKTRKGKACLNLSEAGKQRCKFHGGKSTGPKTGIGRERIAAAQRLRWANWRKNRPE